eukprot:scaffold250738_cov21-Tisochrysis_lutea.AAC.2
MPGDGVQGRLEELIPYILGGSIPHVHELPKHSCKKERMTKLDLSMEGSFAEARNAFFQGWSACKG